MGEEYEEEPPPPLPSKSKAVPLVANINVPPRSCMESVFQGGPGFGFGFSPGPMTLVSTFFSDSDDCKSLSHLLAGAMASPAAFQLNSPSSLLDSPAIFSPPLGPLGMTHQQALAQVTMQAAQAYSHNQIQAQSFSSSAELLTTSLVEKTKDQPMPPQLLKESLDISQSDQPFQSSSCHVDSPADDDGYNWRKYGQKQVKGSEFPRSYYKCTHTNCRVKKKVERSLQGRITEIIYKGEHNHERPQTNKRAKDVAYSNISGNTELSSSHITREQQLSGTSDDEGGSEIETGVNRKDEDEPNAKRQNTEVRVSEPASSHRTLTESRIIVQTTSEVDLLNDGYRWRKYGQKSVKGNSYPRSYYKCTTPRCNVRKHVERASTDQKTVITTYEGKHNHDVPAGKTSSRSSVKSQNLVTEKQNSQPPVGFLQLKKEETT